jgi:hypothetical protein
VFASLLSAAACSAAYADQPVAGPALPPAHIALAIAAPKVRAPYDVQILREDGEALPTYALKDRFYVQGSANERYVIRITNPTARRIEAVASVDGLDVIDGENGDLRKRGYVVPPYGETRIEGFRTSQADVATFRFSSVSGSYAGQKGKARNVGVIAVALFEEQAADPEQQIIVGQAPPPPPPLHRRPYNYRDDLDDLDGARPSASASAPAPRDLGKADAGADRVRTQPSRPRAAKKVAEAPAARPAPAPTGGGYAPPADDDADDEIAPRADAAAARASGPRYRVRRAALLRGELHPLRPRRRAAGRDRRAALQRHRRPDGARHPGPAAAGRRRDHAARDRRSVPRRPLRPAAALKDRSIHRGLSRPLFRGKPRNSPLRASCRATPHLRRGTFPSPLSRQAAKLTAPRVGVARRSTCG